ncbi:unnamed protein product [Lota lota]
MREEDSQVAVQKYSAMEYRILHHFAQRKVSQWICTHAHCVTPHQSLLVSTLPPLQPTHELCLVLPPQRGTDTQCSRLSMHGSLIVEEGIPLVHLCDLSFQHSLL